MFYLRRIKSVLKLSKVPKYHVQDCNLYVTQPNLVADETSSYLHSKTDVLPYIVRTV